MDQDRAKRKRCKDRGVLPDLVDCYALDCVVRDTINGGKYIGVIKNVSAEESVLDENGKVDLSKFHPIIFDGMQGAYHEFGKKVGNAFKDGAALK